MLSFLRDLKKKKLGIAVFFLLPNGTVEEKSEAEKLLVRSGFKGRLPNFAGELEEIVVFIDFFCLRFIHSNFDSNRRRKAEKYFR